MRPRLSGRLQRRADLRRGGAGRDGGDAVHGDGRPAARPRLARDRRGRVRRRRTARLQGRAARVGGRQGRLRLRDRSERAGRAVLAAAGREEDGPGQHAARQPAGRDLDRLDRTGGLGQLRVLQAAGRHDRGVRPRARAERRPRRRRPLPDMGERRVRGRKLGRRRRERSGRVHAAVPRPRVDVPAKGRALPGPHRVPAAAVAAGRLRAGAALVRRRRSPDPDSDVVALPDGAARRQRPAGDLLPRDVCRRRSSGRRLQHDPAELRGGRSPVERPRAARRRAVGRGELRGPVRRAGGPAHLGRLHLHRRHRRARPHHRRRSGRHRYQPGSPRSRAGDLRARHLRDRRGGEPHLQAGELLRRADLPRRSFMLRDHLGRALRAGGQERLRHRVLPHPADRDPAQRRPPVRRQGRVRARGRHRRPAGARGEAAAHVGPAGRAARRDPGEAAVRRHGGGGPGPRRGPQRRVLLRRGLRGGGPRPCRAGRRLPGREPPGRHPDLGF